jgi:hypothetical protein
VSLGPRVPKKQVELRIANCLTSVPSLKEAGFAASLKAPWKPEGTEGT